MVHILVVDNRDSYVYNLVQLLREDERCTYEVHRTGQIPLERITEFDAILLSPGPGLPDESEQMMWLLEHCAPSHCILGVCLGHQALGISYGAKLEQLPAPLHGHPSALMNLDNHPLLSNLLEGTIIGRYHSWVVDASTLPDELIPMAWTQEADGVKHIMAMRHRSYPSYGVQFHPESMITESGRIYLTNWISICQEYKDTQL